MAKARPPALVPFLVFVFVTFIGILIYTWVEAEKADPKMLDESGRVKNTALVRRGPQA
jgi:hypothetical protein